MRNSTFIMITLLLLALACRDRSVPSVSAESVRVKVSSITTGEMSLPVHSSGILSSSEEVKLSFKTGGIIGKIAAREGVRVRKGQLLASLNLSEISAIERQAENGYEKALRDFTRAENLYRDSVVTLELKQNAATALDVARTNLEIARFNLKHSGIIAPENGVILKQLARENELVAAGYPVFIFGSSGKFWKIRTGLSDRDIVKTARGDSAKVTLDAYPGVSFTAVVDLVGEMANPYTGTYDTELLLDASGYRLASGFVAGVDIFPSSKRSFTMVPLGAVTGAQGREGYIFALTGSGTVRKLNVVIEGLTGTFAAISGVPAGFSEVVTEGAAYLRDGMNVTVVK